MIFRNSKRKRKIISVRSKFGRKETHELLLFRSSANIYGYVFSLTDRKTIFSVSTLTLAKDGSRPSGVGKVAESRLVGERIGARCKELSIRPAINVAQYRYHGRVKSLVEGFMDAIN